MMQAFNNIIDLVTGDSRRPEQTARPASVPMLSHFLGYRSYDEEKRIFHQVRSKGFILELAPLVGANDRVHDVIGSLFSDILRPGAKFSVTNYSSPRIAEKLQGWALPRYKASGVFRTLARHRIDKLRNGAWSTLASDGPFFVRSFRVVMAVAISDGSGLTTEDLLTMREGLTSALDSIDVPVNEFTPTDLIRFFDEILAPSTGAGDEVPGYNRFDPINEQCVRRDLVTHVERDRLVLYAQSLRPTGASSEGVPEMKDFVPERFDVRTMAVRNFPDRWAPWDTQKVIGDLFNPKLSLPCPVLQTACGIIPNSEASESRAGYKFVRTSSLAEGKGVKLVPKLRTEAAEWEFVADRVKQGEKLVSCYYAVSILAPKGRGEMCERTLKAL
jgi:conjugal transfer ATP-binding protein TraC